MKPNKKSKSKNKIPTVKINNISNKKKIKSKLNFSNPISLNNKNFLINNSNIEELNNKSIIKKKFNKFYLKNNKLKQTSINIIKKFQMQNQNKKSIIYNSKIYNRNRRSNSKLKNKNRSVIEKIKLENKNDKKNLNGHTTNILLKNIVYLNPSQKKQNLSKNKNIISKKKSNTSTNIIKKKIKQLESVDKNHKKSLNIKNNKYIKKEEINITERYKNMVLSAQRFDDNMEEFDELIKNIKNEIKENTKFRTTLKYYKFWKLIGKGSFGKVYLFSQKLTNRLVAIKTLEKQAQNDDSLKKKIFQEIKILKDNLGHPGILKLFEIFENSKYVFFVTEYMSGGDLLTYLKDQDYVKEDKAKYFFKQIAIALKYIHRQGILHRDIKLDNILLDDNEHIKICDFGVSRYMKKNEIIEEQCGTPAYLSPEVIKEHYSGFGADIWSLGVSLYSLVTGNMPFKANSIKELHEIILEGNFEYPEKPVLSKKLKDLINNMLIVNPNKRFKIEDCLKHEWLDNEDDINLEKDTFIKAIKYEKNCNNYLDEIDMDFNDYAVLQTQNLGFPKDYIIKSIKNNDLNHASACYFSFEKDYL